MKYTKRFEDWSTKNDENFEEFDIKQIIYNLPHKNYNKQNYDYVMSKIEHLIGKYVSFIHFQFKGGRHIRRIINGFVDNIYFDNQENFKNIYIRIENVDDWYIVHEDEPILINKIKSDSNKYNL